MQMAGATELDHPAADWTWLELTIGKQEAGRKGSRAILAGYLEIVRTDAKGLEIQSYRRVKLAHIRTVTVYNTLL